MAVMICLLLVCQSMNTFTEVVERTQIETGGEKYDHGGESEHLCGDQEPATHDAPFA